MDDNSENVKTDELKATFSDVVDTYTWSRARLSASAGSGRFLSKLRTLHREQLKQMIDEFFDSEESDQPILKTAATIPSGNQIEVASNQEMASAQVDATPASQRISPATTSDQPQLVNSGDAQVKEDQIEEGSSSLPRDVDNLSTPENISVTPNDQPQLVNSGQVQLKDESIEEDSSTRPRVDNANTIENTVNISTTGQHQSDCGCDDCLANKGRAPADSVMIVASTSAWAPSSIVHPDGNSNEQSGGEGGSSAGQQSAAANNQRALVLYTGPPVNAIFGDAPASNQLAPFEEDYYSDDDFKSEILSDGETMSEMDSEQNDEEDDLSNISVKSEDISDWENEDEDEEMVLAIEGVPGTEDTGAHGSQEENIVDEQVGNSTDNNVEERDDSQAMELNDDVVNEQPSDAEAINEQFAHEASNSDPVQSLAPGDLMSLPSTSTGRRRSTRAKKKVNYVNSIRKNKSVPVESDSSDSSDDEEFVGQPNTTKRKVSSSGANTKKSKHSHAEQLSAVAAAGRASVREEPLKVITKSLNCPRDDCNTVCKDKTSLNVHLRVKHAIELYRCVVADCTASFKNQSQLTDHHRLGHGNPTDWPCGKCSSSFTVYSKLQNHHYKQHEGGLFECSIDDCDYKETTRSKVYHHQECHRAPKHICDQCDRTFARNERLTVHLQSHSGMMKARCTWPDCAYRSTKTWNVVAHIRYSHFKLPPTKAKQLQLGIIDDRDAHEYIAKI